MHNAMPYRETVFFAQINNSIATNSDNVNKRESNEIDICVSPMALCNNIPPTNGISKRRDG